MSKELKKVTELVMQTPVGDRGQNKRKYLKREHAWHGEGKATMAVTE